VVGFEWAYAWGLWECGGEVEDNFADMERERLDGDAEEEDEDEGVVVFRAEMAGRGGNEAIPPKGPDKRSFAFAVLVVAAVEGMLFED
jgi:hypothetical protein